MGVVEVTEHGANCHCHLSSTGNNKSEKLFSPIKGKMKVLKKIKKRMGLGQYTFSLKSNFNDLEVKFSLFEIKRKTVAKRQMLYCIFLILEDFQQTTIECDIFKSLKSFSYLMKRKFITKRKLKGFSLPHHLCNNN